MKWQGRKIVCMNDRKQENSHVMHSIFGLSQWQFPVYVQQSFSSIVLATFDIIIWFYNFGYFSCQKLGVMLNKPTMKGIFCTVIVWQLMVRTSFTQKVIWNYQTEVPHLNISEEAFEVITCTCTHWICFQANACI